MDRLCLPHYEKVICESQDLYEKSRAHGVSPDHCILIENAIDTVEYQRRHSVEEAKARLKLTAEQEAQLKVLRQERNEALKAIRDRHAGDRSRRARRAMFREAEPVIENYQARVRTILDDSQYAEWEKMRAEARDRLKERYKEGSLPE